MAQAAIYQFVQLVHLPEMLILTLLSLGRRQNLVEIFVNDSNSRRTLQVPV